MIEDEKLHNDDMEMDQKDKRGSSDEDQHGKDFVVIIIDNDNHEIHRGHQTVTEIKTVGNVPLAYELEQVINGVLTPLDDNGAVTIKGEERFVSHPRAGASS